MTYPDPNCPCCLGKGCWIDHIAQQTIICHMCRPVEAGHVLPIVNFKDWDGWSARWPHIVCAHRGPRFQVAPWLLVIHSGERAAHVAEYFRDPGDGRVVSAHVNWSRKEKGFTQGVPFNTVAWHVGGSRLLLKGRLNRKLNFCSIGVELPGPYWKVRPEGELEQLRETVIYTLEHVPSLKYVTRHQDLDKDKRDPGRGFSRDCLSGLGLEWVPA